METLTVWIFVVVATLIMIGLARFVQEKFYGHTLRDMLTDRDNPAMGLAVAGYFFGVVWTLAILMSSPSQGFVQDTLGVLLYGCLGMALLTGVTLGTCRLFFGGGMQQQIVQHNVAAAIVVAALYVATSLTYSGSLYGEGGGLVILLAFFVLGQLALIVISYVFRRFTTYDDLQEIADGNLAAALAMAGLLIGVGLIVSHAVSGTYYGFAHALGNFAIELLLVIVFYPVRQVVVQWIILGGPLHWRATLLDEEIARDKNIAAGLLEATAYISTALFLINVI